MYLYVELWKPRESWHALSAAERHSFVGGMPAAIKQFTDSGIELLGWALNDQDTPHRADFTYLAAWRMPSRDLAIQLERAAIDYGFYDYFEQVNARGPLVDPKVVVEHMAGA